MQSMAATNCVRSHFRQGTGLLQKSLAHQQPITGRLENGRVQDGHALTELLVENCGQGPRQIGLDTAVTDLCFHAEWSREDMVIGGGEQPRHHAMAHPPTVVGVDGRRQGTPYWL